MIPTAMLLIVIGVFSIILLGIKIINRTDMLKAQIKDLSIKLNVCKDALRYAKPIVGAACAASTNENREARNKVYARIERALQ